MKVKIVGSTWVVSDDAVFRFLRLHHVCLIYNVLYIYTAGAAMRCSIQVRHCTDEG